jgi:hypothetical protein
MLEHLEDDVILEDKTTKARRGQKGWDREDGLERMG